MAAHGGTVVEIVRDGDSWAVVKDSPLNRRITASTPMVLTGPAAGHDRLKTSEDPTGTQVLGTINNCAGGVRRGAPMSWPRRTSTATSAARCRHPDRQLRAHGAPGGYDWANFYDRFDIVKEPNAANRFGWIVEVDPFDPSSVPVKRTALGRFKHEGANVVVNRDGHVVAYMGDDERFDYVYKFVTAGTFNAHDRTANADLLDEGTLYVARFDADGTVEWMPLCMARAAHRGERLRSQADVVIEARRAGDLLGATKMDRPEDVQANPRTGKVYVMLTNNTTARPTRRRRQPRAETPSATSSRSRGRRRLRLANPLGDPAEMRRPLRRRGRRDLLAATTENGWFGMPDNCAIDADGRLWVSTDGNSLDKTGRADGLWAVDTEGPARGTSQLFFRVPVGAEMCGPYFTRSGETLFLAVQHPATRLSTSPPTPPTLHPPLPLSTQHPTPPTPPTPPPNKPPPSLPNPPPSSIHLPNPPPPHPHPPPPHHHTQPPTTSPPPPPTLQRDPIGTSLPQPLSLPSFHHDRPDLVRGVRRVHRRGAVPLTLTAPPVFPPAKQTGLPTVPNRWTMPLIARACGAGG